MGPRRVAIVTGAARGIGAAVAGRLARDGMAVAALDLNVKQATRVSEAIRAEGGTAIALSVDVADAASVASAVERVAEELDAPTVLVNNAGILRDNLLFRMSESEWDSVMDVHLKGAFLMSREVQRHQFVQEWGRIINLSSSSALGNRGQANYSAAKAGIQGFTKTLAIELGQFGVTVNAIAPGFIQTDMVTATAERRGMPLQDLIDEIAQSVPLRRIGQPADIAAATSFLCSDEAGYVSGQVIYVAGGPLD